MRFVGISLPSLSRFVGISRFDPPSLSRFVGISRFDPPSLSRIVGIRLGTFGFRL